MRFFIALEIDDKNKAEFIKIQEKIKRIVPEARITDDEKLHLTIAFLGEQPDDLRVKLTHAITESVKDIPPFNVSPGYIDGFPTLHDPRVIWIGVNGDVDKLLVLRERIRDKLQDLDIYADERRYIPHISLAKSNDLHLTEEQEAQLQKLTLQDFPSIHINSVKLFESIADEGFHIHNTLAEIKLLEQAKS